VTQRTAANAEEGAAAAEELSAQSETLKNIVERLAAMAGGGEATNGGQSHRRPSAVNRNTPQRRSESNASLTALRKAVSHQPQFAEHGAPAFTARGAGKNAFPLEEQFKEL
jgi:uncharacterized protein YukE